MRKRLGYFLSAIVAVLPFLFVYRMTVRYEDFLRNTAQGGSAPFSVFVLPLCIGYGAAALVLVLGKKYIMESGIKQ